MSSERYFDPGALSSKRLEEICNGMHKNLRGVDLGNADLSGADLRGAILDNAELIGTELRRADLRGASLRGANLNEALLIGACLRFADLRGANLRGAVLDNAELIGTELRRADLRGASLRGAALSGGAYLSDARGIVTAGPVGRTGKVIYAVDHGNRVMVKVGCQWVTSDDLLASIAEDYADDPRRESYEAAVRWCVKALEASRSVGGSDVE